MQKKTNKIPIKKLKKSQKKKKKMIIYFSNIEQPNEPYHRKKEKVH